jgi:hypothetical protein
LRDDRATTIIMHASAQHFRKAIHLGSSANQGQFVRLGLPTLLNCQVYTHFTVDLDSAVGSFRTQNLTWLADVVRLCP